MRGHNNSVGTLGEEVACEWLQNQRFDIVAKNFRAGHSEIDIVVRDSFSLRFVEVKTRMQHSASTIESSLNPAKFNALKRGIYSFLSSHNDLNRLDIYLDLIIVVFADDGSHSLEYIPDFYRF